jgi:hypothetical protein
MAIREITWKDKLKIAGILFAVAVIILLLIALFGFAFGTGAKISHSIWGSTIGF